jgi:hypothetical protein
MVDGRPPKQEGCDDHSNGHDRADLVELLDLHDVGCVVETTPENFIDMTTLKRCP